jgi:hypothetical protein
VSARPKKEKINPKNMNKMSKSAQYLRGICVKRAAFVHLATEMDTGNDTVERGAALRKAVGF